MPQSPSASQGIRAGAAPAATARFQSSFGDGVYRVGQDIRVGTYRAQDSDSCYWARLHHPGADSISNIITNDNLRGDIAVTIKTSDGAFESQGCGTWYPLKKTLQGKAPMTTFGDGSYSVGDEIAAGTYHTAGQDGCYWARAEDLGGSTAAIIANDNASGPTTVTISPTDGGFLTQSCGTWKQVLHQTARTASTSAVSFGDGSFRVGTDIAPGTYRTNGRDGCYWERTRNLGGSTGAIIANDNAVGPAIVTITSTDGGFVSKDCGTWKRIPTPKTGNTAGATSFGDGTYRVGVDVAPGTYNTAGQDGCYYETLSGFGGTLNEIVANDNPTGPVTITLSPSILGVKSQGCGMWTKR